MSSILIQLKNALSLYFRKDLTKEQKINSNFSVEFEKWLQDHLAYRSDIINVYNQLFQKTSNKVLYGQNDFLFFKQSNSINLFKRNIQLSEKDLAKKIAETIAVANELKNNNIKFYWLIPPDKHSVYPEFFPKNVKRLNKPAVLDQVITYVDNNNFSNILNIIDLRAELTKNKSIYPELYYKTDTHWNQIGAFIGHQQLLNIIKADFKEKTKILSINDFTIKQSKMIGDLSRMLSVTTESTEYEFIPKFQNDIQIKKVDATHFITTNPKALTNKIVVIYRDSFFENLQPFVSHYFKEAHFISSKIDAKELDKIIKQHPDLVISEIVERHV